MLLDVHGSLATKAIVPLTRHQLSWFLSSDAFLRNLDNLKHVGIVPYCTICAGKNPSDAVSARFLEGKGWEVRSACRAGLIAHAVVMRLTLADLLANLGWRLRCGRDCQRLHMNDGVIGGNSPGDDTLSVVCGCTERKYVAVVSPTKH